MAKRLINKMLDKVALFFNRLALVIFYIFVISLGIGFVVFIFWVDHVRFVF